jgi:hypothetical protein
VPEPSLPHGIGDRPAYPRRPPFGSAPASLPIPIVGPALASDGVLPIAPPASLIPPPPPVPPPTTGSVSTPAGGTAAERPVPSSLSARPFVPLRTDPPPKLVATWWLRYTLLLNMLVCIAVVVMTEYALGPGGIVDAPLVIAPHVLAAVLLVTWSALAMVDADRLVPASRYHRGSSALLAAVLWIVAFAVPFGVTEVLSRARDHFSDSENDVQAVGLSIVAAAVGLIVVWLPFGYLAGQAKRIGAPSRVVVLWFVGSLFAAVGSLVIAFVGLHDLLDDRGMTAAERAAQLAVIYGVPATVFALSTWRATTVFDEVIDLRWRTWRREWELTLVDLARQPAPGPELAASDE